MMKTVRHSARPVRNAVVTICFLAIALVSSSAFAEDGPSETSRIAQAARAALQHDGTAAGPTQLDHFTNGVVLRRTTNAVFAALGKGLVIVDIDGKRSDSWLYVKFASGDLPQLRWLTRF